MISDPASSTGGPARPTPTAEARGLPGPEPIARRAPFSGNPAVGQRGQRTRQRILAAALRAFGEGGYHTSTIADLARHAGCSRVTFYQYFSSKEDVLWHLAGQVAHQVSASVEAMGPLTPDGAGWTAIRAWVAQYADIYEHFGAVFHVFESAAREAESLKALNTRAVALTIARIRSKLPAAASAAGGADAMIGLLLGATAHACYLGRILRHAAPHAYPRARVDDAIADIIHRTFFGLVPDVNVHGRDAVAAPPIDFDHRADGTSTRRSALVGAARATHDALLSAGYEAFIRHGYHSARIDDVVEIAGLSHGLFYRYFANKADLARVLVLTAMEPLSSTLAAIPAPPEPGSGKAWSTADLRAWLRTYNKMHASEAGIIRIWVDATRRDASLGTDAAAALDWGRRQIVHFLEPRGFGDVHAEAIVAMALLDVFGGRNHPTQTLEAAVHVIERGLLGR
ncbi:MULTISPECIES: TetR/AcrR family transcriptional regulator [Pseudofrankia]|uniref:TetR/AcrR family transcriptional regulator n=1 Tax=Pseudofrankia TaxID=2994363 RepID=UPI000234CD17|nr:MULTISPECIES: TetR/AcrR family transcriptional regulator [Pseudofrankia]OHV33361.1 TetR family transcriptional regulator [Pseudofrankia sp. EUN1h]